jgi:hypothetical protein
MLSKSEMRIFAVAFLIPYLRITTQICQKLPVFGHFSASRIGYAGHTSFGKFPDAEEILLIHVLFDRYG